MEISLVHAGLAAGAALAALAGHHCTCSCGRRPSTSSFRLSADPRTAEAFQEADADQELAAPAGADGVAGADGAGPGAAADRFGGLVGDQEIPTALGLVFDTSLSMDYKPSDKTRLDEAKERALDLLKKTPDTSQVFVIDTAFGGAAGPLTPASATKSIQGLKIHPVTRKLNVAVADAYAAVSSSDRDRREVYVLTDLAVPRPGTQTGNPPGWTRRSRPRSRRTSCISRPATSATWPSWRPSPPPT